MSIKRINVGARMSSAVAKRALASFAHAFAVTSSMARGSQGSAALGRGEISASRHRIYLELREDDYRWITDRICDVAARHAQGRIVSALEGGYNLSALSRSVEAHLRVLADI